MAHKKEGYITQSHPKTLIIGVLAPYNKTNYPESYFQEFVNLVKTNRTGYDHEMFITLREVDPRTFFTKGKVAEIKKFCDEQEIEEVIISEPLTVQQERNLHEYLHTNIFDRTRLILEIFEKNATSAEGKLQVHIAMLNFDKSRLAGQGVFLSQQAGKIGARGPGETLKERETRHIETAVLKLKRQLESLEKARQTQRKRRMISQVPLICLIGYTNAGKSTVLNALTKSDVLAEDRLFATLDTTTRELHIDKKKVGVISDTVGFIQQLPHQLINAFKSTLSELNYADLLLHVVDVSDPNWQNHIQVVQGILKELDVDKPTLYVFNKADKIESTDQLLDSLSYYQPHVLISAASKDGIAPLKDFLKHWQR